MPSSPTPAETRETCERLLDPPALTIPVRAEREPGLWERLRDLAADGYLLWTVLGLRCVIWAIWRR